MKGFPMQEKTTITVQYKVPGTAAITTKKAPSYEVAEAMQQQLRKMGFQEVQIIPPATVTVVQ